MPDAFSAKQYLEPDDMAMLERVLQKLLPASADAAEREWLGSLLIAAFQNGVTGRGGAVCHDG